ncbi:hypothetical protein H9N25_10655 [Pedobacter riviphilus]|uniref:Uncharacterized protein n=1 Tax=Pedobacter riviphilus TaxID=2766984 RepID=A0ABX6TSW4_9SPHI|nr:MULTISPECIES: DUF6134 family protein [Pedobacter]NII83218.1 hypothetical protein [Pedobacter sp. SG908]QNR86805.1 hypothetical protein H9N25_10655 [Pedobacter riviphilus]
MKKYLLIAILALTVQFVFAQSQSHTYDVFYNEKNVGKMLITKTGNDMDCVIKLNFTASFNVVLKSILIEGHEEAMFEKGILKYSTVLRKVNGKVRANKQTKIANGVYSAIDEGTVQSVDVPEIRSNFLSILFLEPVGRQHIYADNLLQNVKIVNKSAHTYQIPLRNGSYNQYTYVNGKCAAIELSTPFLKLKLKRV